jgi:hypothetical protein
VAETTVAEPWFRHIATTAASAAGDLAVSVQLAPGPIEFFIGFQTFTRFFLITAKPKTEQDGELYDSPRDPAEHWFTLVGAAAPCRRLPKIQAVSDFDSYYCLLRVCESASGGQSQ